jgi:hypothetical protein
LKSLYRRLKKGYFPPHPGSLPSNLEDNPLNFLDYEEEHLKIFDFLLKGAMAYTPQNPIKTLSLKELRDAVNPSPLDFHRSKKSSI